MRAGITRSTRWDTLREGADRLGPNARHHRLELVLIDSPLWRIYVREEGDARWRCAAEESTRREVLRLFASYEHRRLRRPIAEAAVYNPDGERIRWYRSSGMTDGAAPHGGHGEKRL